MHVDILTRVIFYRPQRVILRVRHYLTLAIQSKAAAKSKQLKPTNKIQMNKRSGLAFRQSCTTLLMVIAHIPKVCE